MADKPIVLTDPARELAELLTVLQGGNPNLQGDVFLAGHFGVDAWSQNFLRIVATIMDRLIELKVIVAELDLDDDYRAEMVGHVEQVASAFSLHGFVNAWSGMGAKQVSPPQCAAHQRLIGHGASADRLPQAFGRGPD